MSQTPDSPHPREPGRSDAPVEEEGTLVRSEERLLVGTERVEAGRARLRKHVVTETLTRTVPVSHEQLRISRDPVPAGTAAQAGVSGLSELEHEFLLVAEQPVVQKAVVPVERITLDKVVVGGHQTVTEQVRKERFEVEESVQPGAAGHDPSGHGQPGR